METTEQLSIGIGALAYQVRQLLDSTARDEKLQHQMSGKISRRFAAIRRGEQDVFTRRLDEDGIDSAVLIAIDQSESMRMFSDKLTVAANAARMLALCVSKCPGVKMRVAGFSDTSLNASGLLGNDIKGNAVKCAYWRICKDWNDGIGTLNARAPSLYSSICGTPDTAALNDALKALVVRPEQRKVLILLGDGNGYNKEAALALQDKYRDVIVIAIGIGVDLKSMFKHAVKIDELRDLAKASFKAIIKAIR